MKPRPILVRLLPIVLLTLLAACKPAPQSGGMAGMPPPEVEVVTVAPRSVSRSIEAPGRMQAVRTAIVAARVEGIVERRVYVEGSEVRAGEVLFRIDARTLAANLAGARASLARARAQALIAAQNQERMQALAGSKAISRQDLDQSVAARAQSDAEVAGAQAAVTRAEIELSYATVTAPISGRIGRALVSEGALVGRNEATPLANIEQYDPIWVNFSQSSAEFLRLRESRASKAPLQLVLENGRVYPLPGKLLFNDLAVDPVTGSVGLRGEFPNPDRALLPGQFVTVRLPVAQALNAMVVPQRALQVSPQGQMLLLVGADGKVMPQPVKTGGLSGSDWIIDSGLKGGERVIVNGVQKAQPGMTVKTVNGEWGAGGGKSSPSTPHTAHR